MKRRGEIWLYAFEFPELFCPRTLGEVTGVSAKTVRKHVERFEQSLDALEASVAEGNWSKLERTIEDCLQDAPRSGRPPGFSPLQIVSIISIACEKPEASGRPISKWTRREIAEEAVKRQIVIKISASHVARILRSVNLKPHKTKGWCFTTEKDQEAFAKQVQEVCEVYLQAPQNYEQAGVHTVSIDEATGLQANEKRAETLPPKPDQAGKEETQYTRHGAVCLTAAWHVVLGQVIYHTIQQTRNNDDFANFVEQLLRGDPDGKWVIVVDNLNTHSSEALVRLIARLEGLDEATLGNKKKRKGILGSMKSRKEFLSDRTHRIRFVFTPQHSSWLNQIEVIFGIVQRRGLAGASFKSQQELIERLNSFIHYFNTTFARPMNWTYTGRPTEKENMDQPLTWRQRLKPKSWKDRWNEFQKVLAA
ncbi:MAG: IS630 family transposase [Planctomycetota bacterium]|nr:IS630 family transposase [Planctomycetota bacterium]